MSDPALFRWLAVTAVRIAGAMAAVFGVVLIGRAGDWGTRALGVAIVLAALWFAATVPLALARRWRS